MSGGFSCVESAESAKWKTYAADADAFGVTEKNNLEIKKYFYLIIFYQIEQIFKFYFLINFIF